MKKKAFRFCRTNIHVCMIALMILFCFGWSATAQEFLTTKLDVEGEVQELRAFDLDQDGQKEIVASINVHEEEGTVRVLQIYEMAGVRGREGIRKRNEWIAVPEAVFWAVGQATKDHGKNSCYYLASDGLWDLVTDEPKGQLAPRQRIEAPVFVSYGQEDGLLWMDFIRDWNGDGSSEVFLPFVREARFYRCHESGKWESTDSVGIIPFPIYNNNVLFGRNMGGYQYLSILFFPLLVPADLNGDGRLDLLVLKTGKAHCFLREADGKLSQEARVWDLDIRTREERIQKRATLSFRVADLNRDGCADVVVHKVGVRFTDWKSETAVFLGNPKGTDPGGPYQRFPAGGMLSGVSLEDLDGNGYPDMIHWSIKMGLWPFIEILLRKIIHLESNYYYAQWPEGFDSTPAQSLGHEFRIDLQKQDFFRGLVPNVSGDFNSDGIKDLVAAKDPDTLAVYPGRRKKGFASRPWVTLKATGINYVMAEDLNNDGLCDIYGFIAGEEKSKLMVWVQERTEKDQP